jgi:hypothetical protein
VRAQRIDGACVPTIDGREGVEGIGLHAMEGRRRC